MTRMTGPDCAVTCNLINTHTHTHTMKEGRKRVALCMCIIFTLHVFGKREICLLSKLLLFPVMSHPRVTRKAVVGNVQDTLRFTKNEVHKSLN